MMMGFARTPMAIPGKFTLQLLDLRACIAASQCEAPRPAHKLRSHQVPSLSRRFSKLADRHDDAQPFICDLVVALA
jgi:hypothetical protein